VLRQDFTLADVAALADKGSKLADDEVDIAFAVINELRTTWAPIAGHAKGSSLPLHLAAPFWAIAHRTLRALARPHLAPDLGINAGTTERAVPFNTLVRAWSSHQICLLTNAEQTLVRSITVVQKGSMGDITLNNADSRRQEVWGGLFDLGRLERVCCVHSVAFDHRYNTC
jgi:hypothetical protein